MPIVLIQNTKIKSNMRVNCGKMCLLLNRLVFRLIHHKIQRVLPVMAILVVILALLECLTILLNCTRYDAMVDVKGGGNYCRLL